LKRKEKRRKKEKKRKKKRREKKRKEKEKPYFDSLILIFYLSKFFHKQLSFE